jgi:hypothetical protein
MRKRTTDKTVERRSPSNMTEWIICPTVERRSPAKALRRQI